MTPLLISRAMLAYIAALPHPRAGDRGTQLATNARTSRATAARLDTKDRAILALIQHDTLIPARVIGERVGLSAAAVQRRIKRLRARRVIRGMLAEIDPSSVGLPVTVIIHVDIERETVRHVDAFKAYLRKRPEVQQCWYTTGLSDFVFLVHVASMAAYEEFTREVLMSHDNVARFTSFVTLAEVKSGLALHF